MGRIVLAVSLAFSLALVACGESGGGVDVAPQSSASVQSSASAGSVDYSRAHTVNKLLGRGINLGNALESECMDDKHNVDKTTSTYIQDFMGTYGSKWDVCWNNPIQEEYFAIVKAAGFQSVRIPVRWAEKAYDVPPYTIEPTLIARVKEVVLQANAAGLVAIINIHHFNELYDDKNERDDFEVQREKFMYLWKQIAAEFQNFSNDALVFELLNEGRNQVSMNKLNEMVAEVWPIIRETNPGRTIMINPADFGAYSSLPDIVVPNNDGNVILTGHFYAPHDFTHQGIDGRPVVFLGAALLILMRLTCSWKTPTRKSRRRLWG
jgi:endoglucanase